MSRFDITKTNIAVERLIETTENPRHLYLLHAYNRHRYLEMAGRWEEIFAPDMTVEKPVYHFNMLDKSITLDGAEAVQEVYREHLIWPYDGQGRLIGEDVWEYDESVREIIPLDPEDVLTVEQAGKLLAPLIKPLPSYNPFTA
jgi:hypothetical protein